jgi:hypothetical protein
MADSSSAPIVRKRKTSNSKKWKEPIVMALTQLQNSNTLLSYSLMTAPSPVQVSPSATSPSIATLTFVVSCPRSVGVATVAQITVALPVDQTGKPADPTNLAETAPPLSSASISSTGQDQWIPSAGVAPGVFIFTPKGGPVQVSLQSLTIAFTGIQVNTLVGTALVTINEWAAPGTGAPPPVSKAPSGSVAVAVAKFPYGFFAGDFGTDKPMIQNGQSASLSWVGSVNATYKMLWSTQTRNVSTQRTWPSPALTDTTTFILEVSAQEGGQTVLLYFSLTVIVANPSFTANDLTVLTTSTLEGAVTVGKNGVPASIALTGDLNATDVATTGNVSAGGNVSAAGSLTAGGTGTMPNLTVSGTVQAGILTSSGGLTVAGAASTGNLSANYVTTNGVNSNGTIIGGSNASINAGVFSNNGIQYTLGTKNSTSNGGYITGIHAQVATSSDYGVSSNGYVGTYSGSALLTHLPTRNGYRVVTSPLSVAAEVQVSGTSKLFKGRATVQFEPDVIDIVLWTPNQPYRVLLTAAGQCHGLAVINKSGDCFIVEELGNGASDTEFDWLVIAGKPEALGAAEAATLPKKLPEMPVVKSMTPDEEQA